MAVGVLRTAGAIGQIDRGGLPQRMAQESIARFAQEVAPALGHGSPRGSRASGPRYPEICDLVVTSGSWPRTRSTTVVARGRGAQGYLDHLGTDEERGGQHGQ
jgi:hypothetical protein